MKVLHVISSLAVGGAERLLSDLLPEMKKSGVDVEVLVYKRHKNFIEKKIEDAGIKIISLDFKCIFNPLIVISLLRIFRGYDIIHAHLFPALYQVAIAGVFWHGKLVYTEHSTNNKRRSRYYLRRIEQYMYRRYAKIVCVSKEAKDTLSTWLEGFDDRVSTIANGIDLSVYQHLERDSSHPFTLLMISRFSTAKDHATVIRAMKTISETAQVFLVGDGDLRKTCEDLAVELGVDDRIHFEGIQTDVAHYIAKSDVGILSSHWEGLPLTAIEMMAGGLPVVGSNVAGIKPVLEGAGLLFEEGDAKQLAEIINTLIIDRDYCRHISFQCQNRAKMYDVELTAEKYVLLYQSLIQE